MPRIKTKVPWQYLLWMAALILGVAVIHHLAWLAMH
jgi:hypothetical protein